jgi:hypothetical protein
LNQIHAMPPVFPRGHSYLAHTYLKADISKLRPQLGV